MALSSLDPLATRFLSRALPLAQWTHATHLSVGAWLVHEHGSESALQMLRVGIRALNDQHGTANTSTSGYHETITIAYVRLIDEFLTAFSTLAPGTPLESQVRYLIDGPLAHKGLLLRFWSRALLMSPAARSTWTPPDLAPLCLPPDGFPTARR